jgi:xylan 1,4-beta-xylosidase
LARLSVWFFQLLTFQGIRYSLFSFNSGNGGGFADFDSIDVHEPNPRGLTKPIPHGESITLVTHGAGQRRWTVRGRTLRDVEFEVVDRGLGRVSLRAEGQDVAVGAEGRLALDATNAEDAGTFRWIETFTGELILMSLSTHRHVRIQPGTGELVADSPGPHPNRSDGVRWDCQTKTAR